jgi:ATP synthase H subunit
LRARSGNALPYIPYEADITKGEHAATAQGFYGSAAARGIYKAEEEADRTIAAAKEEKERAISEARKRAAELVERAAASAKETKQRRISEAGKELEREKAQALRKAETEAGRIRGKRLSAQSRDKILKELVSLILGA